MPVPYQLQKAGIVTNRLEIGILLDPVATGESHAHRTPQVLNRIIPLTFQRQQAGDLVANPGVFVVSDRGFR